MANEFEKLLEQLDEQENATPVVPVALTRKELFANLIEEAAILEAVDDAIKAKKYSDTFLYGKSNMSSKLVNFIMRSEEIDRNHSSFDVNVSAFIRANSRFAFLDKVLKSSNVRLLKAVDAPMPSAFKVFSAKDVKGNSEKILTYIDVSGIIKQENGYYKITNRDVPILTSYLQTAMTLMIYNATPARYTRSGLGNDLMVAFDRLFTYVIDYLRCATVAKSREKTIYLACMYFQYNIIQAKELYSEETIRNRALKESGLTQAEASAVDYLANKVPGCYLNINNFIAAVGTVLNAPTLKLDNFIEKWVYVYKAGTQYSLEYFPALASMISNTFHQAGIVNQITIDKVVGSKLINLITEELCDVGRSILGND